jgi:selenocysteine-specific elongation factor
MPIVATAGHVDHGKSTLVQALTGTDPDRWAEEKERGLTIDLGFAWTDIGGRAVGFVDVPGHERFIKNMLAGVGAIDCALLVVAADSGWMPQTEEHAGVLSLLETRSGVIALTRIDLVDDDTVELAMLEILEETEGTSLADWPVVPVSGVTGEGLEVLQQQLEDRIGEPTNTHLPFRMWIDRSFTIQGAGLVVTGSIASGSIRVGDPVVVLPGGHETRIRGLHRHDTPVEEAHAGDRTAVNLVAGGTDEIGRGQLLTTPDSVTVTSAFLGTVTPARAFTEIPKRGAFHVHIGTADTAATIRRVPATNGFVIKTTTPLPMTVGDRFIVRDTGRKAVVGGGRILDPHAPPHPTAADVEALAIVVDASRDAQADALVERRGMAKAGELRLSTGGGTATVGIRAGGYLLSEAKAAEIAHDVKAIVGGYHADYPLRPGIGRSELASQLGLDDDIVTAIVRNDDAFEIDEGAVRITGFTNTLNDADESAWSELREEIEKDFDVPRVSSLQLSPELLHAVIRRGDLIQIDDDLAFTKQQIAAILEGVHDLPDGFTVSTFKDHFGMTRRQAIPTLEWLDRTGVTRRSGDGRTARR